MLADRAIAELLTDPARSDAIVAAAAGCSVSVVFRARAQLEATGAIPRVDVADRARRPDPPLPQRPRRARDRAVRVLAANPRRSDGMLAAAARVSLATITVTRHELEELGQIPVVPVARREHRARPPRPSRARRAILLGARSTREVSARAGVTRQWAWQARKTEQARPKMPRPPLPPVACEQCGNMFSPSRRQHVSRPQRYCSDSCAYAADRARRRANRPPPEPKPPKITELLPFDFSKGTCTHVPPSQASWWTSDNPVLREGAANICGVCPILHLCLDWSLSNLPRNNNVIYAGLGAEGRKELRRMIRDQRR